jgi:hypothetical protein
MAPIAGSVHPSVTGCGHQDESDIEAEREQRQQYSGSNDTAAAGMLVFGSPLRHPS